MDALLITKQNGSGFSKLQALPYKLLIFQVNIHKNLLSESKTNLFYCFILFSLPFVSFEIELCFSLNEFLRLYFCIH